MAAKPQPTLKQEPEAEAPAHPDQSVTTLATSSGEVIPSFLQGDAAQYGGAGTSDRKEDNVLPYLYIVQKGSPQVNKRDPDYMEGVEVGDILNTATRQVYKSDVGVLVIPAYLCHREVEWIPRGDGGGYVATHESDTPLLKQVLEVPKPTGKGVIRMLPNGHQLVSTAYHLVVPVDAMEIAVIALTSTGLQTSRRWNSQMRSHKVPGQAGPIILPSFSRVYRLRTVYQKNESGDWFSFAIDDEGWVNQKQLSAYTVAKTFFISAESDGVVMGRPPAALPGGDDGKTVDHDSDDAPI